MDSKTYLNNKQFFKPDYYKALNYIIPKFLQEDDRGTFGEEIDLVDQIINKHILFAVNISSVLPIDSIPGTQFSSMNSINSISPFFVKQNNLTNITTEHFNKKILNYVGEKLSNFDTSSEFSEYLTDTLLPSIRLNNPTSYFRQGADVSASHRYLIENLSWLYFLNTSGTSYNPSSFVHDILISKTYTGRDISLKDCMEGLSEFIWRNNLTQYIPESFISSTGTYTSGTQQLDKLKTWMEIIYSPRYVNRSDFTVSDKFSYYIENASYLENNITKGPFTKLIRALGFAANDSDDTADKLGALYDLESCPAEYLPYVAELIGWRLFGTNPDRWRLQLRNAVEVYKRVGTKAGLQFAVNSLFPKDQFDIETRITELWESYIPYLIYYSLATESSFFENNTTWTPGLAHSMNVSGYSTSSIDENIKLAVDRIIYETYLEYKDKFGSIKDNDSFNYRGREYPIPPFEEYPYYVNIEVTQDMIDFITDRLVCFGVRKEFALQVRDYLIDNVISSDDEIRSSSWLFFTSGYNSPPNVESVITNIINKKFEYVSLWNGKSSHFKLIFDSSEFDFVDEDDLDYSSGNALQQIASIVHEFSPAHSIPLINIQLSTTDAMSKSEDLLPLLNLNIQDYGTRNHTVSGLNINSYKRTYNTSGNVWDRSSYNSMNDSLIVSANLIGNVPRNSLRRRNYEKVIPKNGYYDRTGFNMPITYDMEVTSGIPLGFIPSSLQYAEVSSPVYNYCNTTSTSASFFGYNVSATIPCRGLTNLTSRDKYIDRGQTPDIYILMHDISEKKKLLEASSNTTFSSLYDFTYLNVYQNIANSATNSSVSFPNNIHDYYNFRFGVDLHTLYNVYTKEFDRHRLVEALHYLDGPNIFSNIFGSILRNSKFEFLGAAASTFITSSLSSITNLNNSFLLFSISGLSGGSYVASTTDSIFVDTFEFRASSILNGIEFVQTSGSSPNNRFRIFKIPYNNKPKNTSDYLVDKVFIQSKSINGLPRLRFDMKTYECPSSEGHPVSSNFLLPECNYKFSVKSLASNSNGTLLGGASLGVWIHTKSEGNKVWSYTSNGWVQHDSLLSKTDLLTKYTHIFNFSNRDRLAESRNSENLYKKLNCIELLSGISDAIDPLLTFDEQDFEEFEVNFNTNNKDIIHPESYFGSFGQLHRKSQNYIIEVFKLPDNTNRDVFVLFDSVNLVNSTLNNLSKFLVSGTELFYPMRRQYCPEARIDLTKTDIQTLFKFWNDIAGKNSMVGYASRNSITTSSIMFDRGGSRADYRDDYAWNNPTYFDPVANPLVLEIVRINL